MAKRPDSFYFDNFRVCAGIALEASQLLSNIMNNFDPEAIEDQLHEMHHLEQSADEKKHEINDALITAFITPIDREDIALLSDTLDTVIDRIEGVLQRLYFDNVREIRPDALQLVDAVTRACKELCVLMDELPRFKKSKGLQKHVVAINTIEGECDDLYVAAMRKLHTTESDLLTVIAWREVYAFREYCAGSCEHVAETGASIVMKNS